jgi:predicted nucleic acid-binding protein
MYLLDAPLLDELRRPQAQASAQVRRWAADVPMDQLFISALTLAAMEQAALEAEARGDAASEGQRLWLADLRQAFALRILPFTTEAIDGTAAFAAAGFSLPDAALAALANQHQCVLVTPEPARFAKAGVKCFNPWAP